MAILSFIGDDFYNTTLTLQVDSEPVDFSAATLVRWWMVPAKGGVAAFSPITLTNSVNGNDFANGKVVPILTAAQTSTLVAQDYAILVEITLGAKVSTFRYSSYTFTTKGV